MTYLKSRGKGLCSGWKFWKTHSRLVAYLLREAGLTPHEHAKLQDSGPLERHQMVYLLHNYPPIQQWSQQVQWVPLYFAFGRFQMSLEELQSASAALQSCLRKDIRAVVFLLGITNHWSILIYEWQEDRIHTIYLDSKNPPEVFSAVEADILHLLAVENEFRLAKGLEVMNPYQVKMRRQHIIDLQMAISMIEEVASGIVCFSSFLLTQEIQCLHETYMGLSEEYQGEELIRLWVFEAFQPISHAINELIRLSQATKLHPACSSSLLLWLNRLLPLMTEEVVVNGDEKEDLKLLVERFPVLVETLEVEKC